MKVNVRRVRAGMTAGAAGCSPADGDEGPASVDSSGEPLAAPGSGDLELQLGPASALHVQLTSSTTDEFVRVGQELRGALPGYILWQTLHPNDPVPDDARLSQLDAKLSVQSFDRAQLVSTHDLAATERQSTLYGLYAYTGRLLVPARTDTLQFELTLTDAANPQASAHLDATQIGHVPVFGGDLPNKTLLFDQNQGVLRQRVLEGGALVAGARVTLGYTDWRADQMVDRTNLDTQIGVATGFGRFGQYQQSIHGKLVFEVAVGIHFNDAAGWRPELLLAANTSSRMLGAGRTDYEAEQIVPAGVDSMSIYGHVKAILVADYTPYENITQKWYQDGERVLLKDVYDNPNGAFTNYDFRLQ
jgi:hypothetical protein